ncbi:MAG: hypothetical protein J0L73_06735 [Verrucomicrobia bacterium]|nr:hypothetical protein [Verrucomicrobiota bacterium]
MKLQIVRYEDRHVEAVKRLNARLAAAGETWSFPERTQSNWLPDTASEDIIEHYYIAEEGDEVRGGYILKWQPFWIEGRTERVCTLYLPLSEGIINQRYKLLGLILIRDALTRNPLAFCLGMGGAARPLPQTLKMLGWQVHDVPFFFMPLCAGRFLTNLQPLQTKPWKRMAVRVASITGVAAAGLALVKMWRRAPGKVRRATTMEVVELFGDWADELWQEARSNFSLCADRARVNQNRIYRDSGGENIRVLVRSEGKPVGWFVARCRAMSGHKYFGNMRVGSIIDVLAHPGHETHVAWAARQFLNARGADIIVCNLQHKAWRDAILCAGFFKGPSNFALAASPKLCAMLPQYAGRIEHAQFMRGDGEGPTHL